MTALVPEVLSRASASLELEAWERFYRERHDLKIDLAGLVAPPKTSKTPFLVVVPEGFNHERALRAIAMGIEVCSYLSLLVSELDKLVVKNERWPVETYAIRVAKDIEPDTDLMGLTADDIDSLHINTETLLEHSLHAAFYAFTHRPKGYLDKRRMTLCSGSRLENGDVPISSTFSFGDIRHTIDRQGATESSPTGTERVLDGVGKRQRRLVPLLGARRVSALPYAS